MISKPVAIQCRHEHGSRGIPIAWNRYLAVPGEDPEALMFVVVICKVCKPVRAL
jgi:hypothetical protein